MPFTNPWSLWDTVLLDLKENGFPNMVTLADALRKDPGDVPVEVREFLAERAKAGAIRRDGKRGSPKEKDALEQHFDDLLIRATYEDELERISETPKADRKANRLEPTRSAALRASNALKKVGIELGPEELRKRALALKKEVHGAPDRPKPKKKLGG